MQGFCSRCGECCMSVYPEHSVEDIEYWLENYPDGTYVEQNRDSLELIVNHWEPNDDGSYRCNMLDQQTMLCTNENRPRVCTDYPYYGEDRGKVPSYRKCGYQYDLPRAERSDRILPIALT